MYAAGRGVLVSPTAATTGRCTPIAASQVPFKSARHVNQCPLTKSARTSLDRPSKHSLLHGLYSRSPPMQRCDRAVATHASSAAAGDALPTGPTRLEKLADVLTMMFPLWALISGVVAYRHPASLNWITGAQFEAGVGTLMLAMGLSLTKDDFRKCVSNPVPILCGFAAQYAIMPSLALAISRALGLSPGLSVGLILLGCCPGGQASNIATYVANGDVALSVIMTAASTLAATVMTPLLTSTLAGRFVPVSTAALAASTVKLVLLPTLAGVVLNETLPGLVGRVRPAMPLLAILLTVVLCATPVAQVAPLLALHGASACLPVLLLHTLGYFFGYLLPRVLGFGERTSRTVSIETGMQSAAMGYALSTKHFADVLVAMPSAVSILFMVWIGAALAVVWRLVPIKDDRHAA
ncbi:hypothetical protein ACKKBG_A13970 [Auxenochlorella protothecoides x Auxenochlorella symbiontica]